MSESVPVVRRLAATGSRPGTPATDAPPGPYAMTRPYDAESAPVPSRQLDELVDLVVERIEARVVDELERRGRRTAGW